MGIKRTILLAIGLLWLTIGYSANLKKLFRLLDKSDIEKAVELLLEELEEEPDNPALLWISARFTSTDTLAYYDIDSAYFLIKKALVVYDSAGVDFFESFEKIGYNRSDLEATDIAIRDMHWSRVRDLLTIESIRKFREMYPESPQNTKAIYLRDSLAYMQVSEVNNWHAYGTYIRLYPNSEFYERARDNYDILLFKDKTKHDTFEEYQHFASEHPESPYLEKAIERILYYQLTWNSVDTLVSFIHQYPESRHVESALNYLYHLDTGLLVSDQALFRKHSRFDSLVEVHALNQLKIYPYPIETGTTIVTPDFSFTKSLNYRLVGDEVYCGTYPYDFFVGKDRETNATYLISRSGQTFYETSITGYADVGLGIIWINTEAGGELIHKSGVQLASNIDEARLIDKNWIKVRRGEKWSLISLNGMMQGPFIYDDILKVGNFWIFEKEGLFAFTNREQVDKEIGKGGFTLIFKYDDYELISEDLMIGFKDEMEGLINSDLDFIIPWGLQSIFPNISIPYAKRGGNYYLYASNELGFAEKAFQDVLINKEWIALRENTWRVAPLNTFAFRHNYDSVRLIGENAIFTSRGDSSYLHYRDITISLSNDDALLTLSPPVQDGLTTEKYLQLTSNGELSILDKNGRLLIRGKYKEVRALGDSLFAVRLNKKTGVIHASGRWIVKDNYDFVQKRQETISLLKDRKIGAYVLKDSLTLEARYSSVIDRLGHYYKTSLDGMYGLVDSLGSEVLPFAYLEIDYFNDSLYWVKTDSSWQVRHITDQQIYQYGIRSYEPLGENHTAFKVLTSSGYGVLSTSGRYLVPGTFSDIRVISDGESQFFIGEKSVPEAGFYLWVGYDSKGKRIFSEAYREDLYDSFACD